MVSKLDSVIWNPLANYLNHILSRNAVSCPQNNRAKSAVGENVHPDSSVSKTGAQMDIGISMDTNTLPICRAIEAGYSPFL